MKRHYYMIAGAALLTLAGCSREPLAEDTGTEILSAVIVDEGTTRTTYDGATGKFDWEANDEIALLITNGTSYRTQVDKVTPISTERTGTFVYSKETGWTRTAYAVYPVSVYPLATARNYSGTLTLTLPATYAASASTPLPLVAVNSNGEQSNLAFKPACGLLRIKCQGISGTTVTVTLDKDVTGDFDVTNPGTVPAISTTGVTDKNVVTFTGTGASATLDLPLPFGTYGSVTVSDGTHSKTVSVSFTMGRDSSGRVVGKKMRVNLAE